MAERAAERVSAYEAVIGLEVHAQLATESKLFCGCSARYGGAPNSQTCPTCLGLPGALPVPNEGAIEMAAKVGLALGGEVREESRFDRKSYFYPDLPKGYQITQYERPLIEGGALVFLPSGSGDSGGSSDSESKKIRLERIHVEEDAAKNLHGAGLGGRTAVDFNRAGVPLIEIVGAPELRSGAEAEAYLRALRELLLTLGVNDGNLEEGSLRCDANVSLRRHGEEALGVRTELKNLNSMRFVRRAIEAEIERQAALLDAGDPVLPETRAFDDASGRTVLLRAKEGEEDYRYFPDPDLPPVRLTEERIEALRAGLPELPEARRRRFREVLGLDPEQAQVLGAHPRLAAYLEEAAERLCRATSAAPKEAAPMVARWLKNELLGEVALEGLSATFPISAEALGGLLALVWEGTLSGTMAKSVYKEMKRSGRSAASVVRAEGLRQITDEASLLRVVDEVMAEHPAQVAAYRAGKEALMGFFVGQAMRATKGAAQPTKINALLRARLEREPGEGQG